MWAEIYSQSVVNRLRIIAIARKYGYTVVAVNKSLFFCGTLYDFNWLTMFLRINNVPYTY